MIEHYVVMRDNGGSWDDHYVGPEAVFSSLPEAVLYIEKQEPMDYHRKKQTLEEAYFIERYNPTYTATFEFNGRGRGL